MRSSRPRRLQLCKIQLRSEETTQTSHTIRCGNDFTISISGRSTRFRLRRRRRRLDSIPMEEITRNTSITEQHNNKHRNNAYRTEVIKIIFRL